MTDAIVAEGLVKRYGSVTALDGMSLTVPEGTVLGVLGPNGSGKTTTVQILTTLQKPDEGHATVAGFDVVRDAHELRSHIGASGQYAAVDEHLTGAENLEMVGRLYHLGTKRAKARGRELLARFSLEDAADRPVKGYSGGMRRRLDLAGALVANPPVLFLDEPTTGLDPRARTELWDVITELVAGGTTLLLTTQYLEEADQLADHIVVVDRGRIIAEGTPLQLKQRAGNASLVVTVSHAADLPAARELISRTGVDVHVDIGARQLTATAEGIADLTRVAGWLQDRRIEVDDIGLSRPSLDDVFLSLTGHRAEDDEIEEARA